MQQWTCSTIWKPGDLHESIRHNAPLQYAAQDRAVTTTDYETLVQSIYPNALSVSAWGGEDDETPQYGVVKIAIKAASGSTLTDATKTDIVTRLRKFNVASVRPEIIDPETTFINEKNRINKLINTTLKETTQLENNLGFFSKAKGKMLEEFQSKIEKNKVKISDWRDELKKLSEVYHKN